MSMLQNCCAVMASRCGIRTRALHVIVRGTVALEILVHSQQVCRHHGQSFRICAPPVSHSCCAICASVCAAHLVILTAVVAAVACSVGTQYGVKNLVDSLSAGPSRAGGVWLAFVFLMSLIAADNLFWRVASSRPLHFCASPATSAGICSGI